MGHPRKMFFIFENFKMGFPLDIWVEGHIYISLSGTHSEWVTSQILWWYVRRPTVYPIKEHIDGGDSVNNRSDSRRYNVVDCNSLRSAIQNILMMFMCQHARRIGVGTTLRPAVLNLEASLCRCEKRLSEACQLPQICPEWPGNYCLRGENRKKNLDRQPCEKKS